VISSARTSPKVGSASIAAATSFLGTRDLDAIGTTEEGIQAAAERFDKLADELDPATAEVTDVSDLRAVAEAAEAVRADEARLTEAVQQGGLGAAGAEVWLCAGRCVQHAGEHLRHLLLLRVRVGGVAEVAEHLGGVSGRVFDQVVLALLLQETAISKTPSFAQRATAR
jgi:hypothetical protein